MVVIHYENTVTPYNVWRMSDEVRQRIFDPVRRRMKIKWEQVTTMEHLRGSRCAQQGAVLKYSGKVLMTGLLRQQFMNLYKIRRNSNLVTSSVV